MVAYPGGDNALYQATDFTKNDSATYKAQIDANMKVLAQRGNMFNCHAQQTPSMRVEVDPGMVFDGTTLVIVGAYGRGDLHSSGVIDNLNSTTGMLSGQVVGIFNDKADVFGIQGATITTVDSISQITTNGSLGFDELDILIVTRQRTGVITAPVSNSRIDRVVANRLTGVISVITGTPGASPSPPAITAGNFPIAQIKLTSTSTIITNDMITDERVVEAAGRGTAGDLNLGTGAVNDGSNNLIINQLPTSVQFSGVLSPASIGGNQNDYNPASLSTTGVLRLTSSGNFDITGLQGGASGRIILLVNIGANILTLKNLSGSSSAANQFSIGADVAMLAGQSFALEYDSTSSLWRPVTSARKDSGVTAAAYTNANVTVDRTGAVTAASNGSSSLIDRQTFNASGTWTKPSNMGANAMALIECWGAGASGSRNSAAGGGGGGARKKRWIPLSSLGSTETVTIGTGGASQSSNANGVNGSDTTFGSWVTAYGGVGGSGSNGGPGGGLFGKAAAGTATNATESLTDNTTTVYFATAPATLNAPGTNGGDEDHGGAGAMGNSGGTGAAAIGGGSVNGGGGGGGSASATAAGAGGTSQFAGNGGAGGLAGGNATAGTQPAGGGGGARTGNSGAGADGRTTITVFSGS